MSGSTVSITANHGSTARRRTVEKTVPAVDSTEVGEITAAKTTTRDTDDTAILKPKSQGHTRRSGQTRKPPKSGWMTVVSILTKNLALLVVLLGFVQMIRWVVYNAGRDADSLPGIYGDFDGKFAEVERFVKKTVMAMQVQVDAVDRKTREGISSVRKEFDEKLEKKGEEMDLKFKALEARNDGIEKFLDDFAMKGFLLKEEFGEFFEEFKKERKRKGVDSGEVTLDDVKAYAREIVEKEIEKHSADGLGMVDYALTTGGGKVIRHSEPVLSVTSWALNGNRVSPGAEKMLSPSFGEPGQCFALKGGSGFVEIVLRAAIIPNAFTLEHIAKSVAFDRSSAPKECRIFGWMHGQGPVGALVDGKKYLLAEFSYDLEKSNAQTYNVLGSAAATLVNTIRFEFSSNHGHVAHTCIYRLRVHGHEPSAVPMLESNN